MQALILVLSGSSVNVDRVLVTVVIILDSRLGLSVQFFKDGFHVISFRVGVGIAAVRMDSHTFVVVNCVVQLDEA